MLIASLLTKQDSTMAVSEALRKISLVSMIKGRRRAKTDNIKEVVLIDDGSIEMVSLSRQLNTSHLIVHYFNPNTNFHFCRLT